MIKNRIFYYDFLRAFAIIAVILCHVDGMYEFTSANLKLAIPLLLNDIGLMGVPIFLMLTGALLLGRKQVLGEFFKKRFTRIVYPYIFWVVLMVIIGVICLSWNSENVLRIVLGVKTPIWYVWMLVGIYLTIPILNSFLNEHKLKGLEFFLAIWLITILLNTFRIYPFYSLELSYFAGYIGYVVLGYYLDNREFKLSDRKLCCIGAVILVVSTVLHMAFSYYHVPVLSPKYHNIIIVLQAVGMFLFIKYIDKISIRFNGLQNNIIGKLAVSISICSYGMYFAHYIIIQFLKRMDTYSLKMLPVFLIVVVVLSWLVTFVFSKIPYVKKVSGV